MVKSQRQSSTTILSVVLAGTDFSCLAPSVFLVLTCAAALCTATLSPTAYPKPFVAAGYSVRLFATDLSRPR
jgi:hypothetical protein